MARAFSRVRIWLGGFGRRRLALVSPYPVAECLQRLEMVTSSRGPTTWYLSSRSALLPPPLFKGELYQSRTRLRRFATAGSQNTFLAMLEVQLDPRADGGTTLSGWIGRPAGAFQATLLTGMGSVVSLGLLTAGVVQLALGHIVALVPTLASPLPAAFMAGFYALGRRSLDSDIAELTREVGELLDATGVAGQLAVERLRVSPLTRQESPRSVRGRKDFFRTDRGASDKRRRDSPRGSAWQVRSRWLPARTARRWC